MESGDLSDFPKLQIELDEPILDIYQRELKTITLTTMKAILLRLYKDPLVMSEKEATIMAELKARGLL